jgi:hypothetical protein
MDRVDRAFEELKRAVDAGEMEIGLDLVPLSLPGSSHHSQYDGFVPTIVLIGIVCYGFWVGLYPGLMALSLGVLFFAFVVRRYIFWKVRRRVLTDVLQSSFQWDSFWQEGHVSLRCDETDDVFSPDGDWVEFVLRERTARELGQPPAERIVVSKEPFPQGDAYLQQVVAETAAAAQRAETEDKFGCDEEENEIVGEPSDLDLEGFAIRILAPSWIDRSQVIGEDFHETYKQEIFLLLGSLRDLGLLGSETYEHPNPPKNCDCCGHELALERWFIDGATEDGPWANMCQACFRENGRGIKFGMGQAYLRIANGDWRMVAGGEVPR